MLKLRNITYKNSYFAYA